MKPQRPLAVALVVILLLLPAHALGKGRTQDDGAARILRIESALQPPAQLPGREVSYRLADRMAYYKVPGLSAAVFVDGELAWARAYGVLEAGSPRAVDTHTLFQAASISKPLTATLAIKAVDRGLIDLDRPANELLRAWKIPDNDFTRQRPVTLRLLLTHRAGIVASNILGFKEGEPLPSLVQLLAGEPPAVTPPATVDVLPGTEERYSNLGYVVVQQMLIDVLGVPFAESMQREVLEPSRMKDSTFDQPLRPERRANAATGHKLSGEPIAGKYRVHPDLAPSGLWSTPSDICRWAIAFIDAWRGTSERLLSRRAARQSLGEGLIPTQEMAGGDLRFGHAGNNVGFTCVVCAYTRGCGVAIMTNSNNFEIINELLRAIAIEYGWEDLKPPTVKVATLADLSRYAGSYKVGDETITASVAGDHLVVVTPSEGTLTVYPESATDFFIYEQGLPLKFEFDAAGTVVRARNANGIPIEKVRP